MPLSPEAVAQIEQLRQLLMVELGDQTTTHHFALNDAQVLDLAAGYVPDSLKAMFRASLDWHAEDQRRADANDQRHAAKQRDSGRTGSSPKRPRGSTNRESVSV